MGLKITDGTVKVNKDHQGTLVDLGILESDRKYRCVGVEDTLATELNDKVHAIMQEALENIIGQFEDLAEANDISSTFQRDGMLANIAEFNLMAGSGFSTVRKADIIADKYDSLVEQGVEEPTVALFLPPKAGATVAKPKEAVKGGLSL